LTQLFTDESKLKHEEIFKICTQRKGEENNINSEYVQNSDTGIYRLLFLIKNLYVTCTFIF